MKPLNRIVPSSVTMSLDKAARELIASGKDVINLTAGQVDLPMPECGKEAIRSALEADRTHYVPATGSIDLKNSIRRKMGWTEGSILVSAGAKPLLSAAVACLCGPGDDVLLPSPCYTSYPEMILLAGANPVPVSGNPRNRFLVSSDLLEAAVSDHTKAILVNHPVNPTGAVYHRDELREIADFCTTHDLYIIADEVYSTFVYDEPFASFYDLPDVRERLVLINSTSKAYSMAGLRLGYAVAPKQIADAVSGLLSHALGCPCSLSERAAKAVLNADDTYCLRLKDVFHRRRDRLWSLISAIPGICAEKSAGAFYLWLDIRAYTADDVAFCRDLLAKEGVALTPGSAFLCPGFVRVAYTQPEEVLIKAADRLQRFVMQPGS